MVLAVTSGRGREERRGRRKRFGVWREGLVVAEVLERSGAWRLGVRRERLLARIRKFVPRSGVRRGTNELAGPGITFWRTSCAGPGAASAPDVFSVLSLSLCGS